MIVLKGFMAMASLANNTANSVAPFGELSTYSRTFSRDLVIHDNPAIAPSVELVSFRQVNDAGASVSISAAARNFILTIGEWIFQQHIGLLIPTESNRAAFIQSLGTMFPTLDNINIGEIKVGAVPGRYMPEWVSFDASDNGTDLDVKFWLSDTAFRSGQYDDHLILLVPPLPDIDALNTSTVALQAALANPLLNLNNLNQAQAFAQDKPYTALVPFELQWHNPTNPNSTLTTIWLAVVYGQAGQDVDNIRTAIREYIASTSALTIWPNIYPSLYQDSEFIYIPLWDRLAVPDNGVDQSVFTGAPLFGDFTQTMASRVPLSYGTGNALTTHLTQKAVAISVQYQGATVLCVGSPNNQNNIETFTQVYPDYINVPTVSSDFARMGSVTQAFSLKLNEALAFAKSMTASSTIPAGYTALTRGDHRYLCFSMDGYLHMVMAAYTFNY